MSLKITLCFTFATFTAFGIRDVTATECRRDQWRCRDGTCIPFDGKCDGVVNCLDGSDESHALCRNLECQSNWFRCTYGACVDGTAPCNGTSECADGSDELLPRCRHTTITSSNPFRCDDGTEIPFSERCDGVVNCKDGSDEIVKTCSDITCLPYYFQCAYGACVDHGAECDGIKDCSDNSDERDDLCNRVTTTSSAINKTDTTTSTTTTKPYSTTSQRVPVTTTSVSSIVISTQSVISTSSPSSTDSTTIAFKNNTRMCKLPLYPEHGTYVIENISNDIDNKTYEPGLESEYFGIRITCNKGYGVIGEERLICFSGDNKFKTTPKCVKFCKMQKSERANYRCKRNGTRVNCEDLVPPGTIAEVDCIQPVYYSPAGSSTKLTCQHNGNWDGPTICVVDCGKVISSAKQLMIGGKNTAYGQFPWHTAIYRRDKNETTGITEMKLICGGSLISHDVVVSAAHCFWNEIKRKPEEASRYAVGLGKIYSRWENPKDDLAEYYNVTCLKIPEHYDGALGNYQSDIAVLKLNKQVTYKNYIKPICLDTENKVHIKMEVGRVAGWGLINEEEKAASILQYGQLPYVKLSECRMKVPNDFTSNLAIDKFCAGEPNGTALREGDSGGGLVFPDGTSDNRYYLKGIVSTSPDDKSPGNKNWITTFTDVMKHLDFINYFKCDKKV